MKQLIWHGPIWGQSGYEVITRGMLTGLDHLGVRVRVDETNTWNREKISMPWEMRSRLQRMINTTIARGTPVIMHQQSQPIVDKLSPGTKKYCYTLFETDTIPKKWIKGLKEMDGIFTFSNFNKECWSRDLPADKIHVLPWGVDPAFNTNVKKTDFLNAKGYIFLANGDFIERKNFDTLIEAYVKEFKPNEDVTLILKTHYGGFTRAHKDALLKRIIAMVKQHSSNPPKILFYPDKITVEDMAILYRSVDCLVMPSRGEGLGLPVIEAMACGLPVIAAGWSSLAEIPFQGVLIEAKAKTIDSEDYIQKCPHALNHKWGEIKAENLQKSMRFMFQNQEKGKEMGKENAQICKGRTWHNAALKIAEVIYGTN